MSDNRTPNDSSEESNKPSPLTMTGTLDALGMAGPLVPLPGFKPDLEWFFSRPRLVTTITVSTGTPVGTPFYTFYPFKVLSSFPLAHWQDLFLSMSKFWNGSIVWRFAMVKPPRVVGRLMLKYRPEAVLDAAANPEPSCRDIVKEWDLSASDFVEMEFNGFNAVDWRPVRVSNLSQSGDSNVQNFQTLRLGVRTPLHQHFGGTCFLQVVQALQPGSIFPDSYTILVEVFMKNMQLAERADFRHIEHTNAPTKYALLGATTTL